MFVGEDECVDGECSCADGYVPNAFQTACIKCPGFGDSCYEICCSTNNTLYCWRGVCQPCVDQYGAWVCQETPDNFSMSVEQLVVAGALLLGVIAVFLVLHDICYVPDRRELANYESHVIRAEGRASVSSLQFYFEQRLRDAPPRYTRSASSRPFVVSEMVFVNAAFVHDGRVPAPSSFSSSPPPPPYNAEERSSNTTSGQAATQDYSPATAVHI